MSTRLVLFLLIKNYFKVLLAVSINSYYWIPDVWKLMVSSAQCNPGLAEGLLHQVIWRVVGPWNLGFSIEQHRGMAHSKMQITKTTMAILISSFATFLKTYIFFLFSKCLPSACFVVSETRDNCKGNETSTVL